MSSRDAATVHLTHAVDACRGRGSCCNRNGSARCCRRAPPAFLINGKIPVICPTCQMALSNAGGRRLLCMGLFSIFWKRAPANPESRRHHLWIFGFTPSGAPRNDDDTRYARASSGVIWAVNPATGKYSDFQNRKSALEPRRLVLATRGRLCLPSALEVSSSRRTVCRCFAKRMTDRAVGERNGGPDGDARTWISPAHDRVSLVAAGIEARDRAVVRA